MRTFVNSNSVAILRCCTKPGPNVSRKDTTTCPHQERHRKGHLIKQIFDCCNKSCNTKVFSNSIIVCRKNWMCSLCRCGFFVTILVWAHLCVVVALVRGQRLSVTCRTLETRYFVRPVYDSIAVFDLSKFCVGYTPIAFRVCNKSEPSKKKLKGL